MDAAVVEKKSIPAVAWVMWTLGTIFVLFQFFVQLATGEITGRLMQDFHISAAVVGNLSASFFYAYLLFQLPVGILLDRFGVRRTLTCAVLSLALGAFIFATAHSVFVAAIGRAFMGAGSAFSFVGVLCLVAIWFPPRLFSLMVGLCEMVGMFGTAVGENFLSESVLHYGWRDSMLIVGVLGVLLAIAMFLFIRESAQEKASKDPNDSAIANLKHVVTHPQYWLLGIYGFFMFGLITGFCAIWAVPFLMNTYHYSLELASFFVSIVLVGVAAGCPLQGWISLYVSRKRLMIIGAFLVVIFFSCMLYIPNLPKSLMMILLFLSGFMMCVYLQVFAVAKEITVPEHRASAMAFTNMVVMSSPILLQPLIGWFLTIHSGSVVNAAVQVFSAVDFRVALSILPVGFGLSVLCALCVKTRLSSTVVAP
ncbi:MAG: MFS transporter [Gammaproteobacteria bacterium]